MKKTIFVVLILMGCSCASKPAGTEGVPASGKATRQGQNDHLELFATLISGPESAESLILTNSGVLSCLQDHVEPADSGFSIFVHLQLKGRRAQSSRVDGGTSALRSCLEAFLPALVFAGDASQSIAIRISRTAVAGKKGRPFLLPLKGIKKFE